MNLVTPTHSSWLGIAVSRIEANYQRSAYWRCNNIAKSMFSQMSHERFAPPRWIVVGAGTGSRIGGIGRPRFEDVEKTDLLAAMQTLKKMMERKVGPSTGTNFYAVLTLAKEMLARGESRSILSLLCNSGERYLPTYYDTDWVQDTVECCVKAQQRIKQMIES